MKRVEIWHDSLSKFNIPPESNVSLFLRDNEKALLDGTGSFSSDWRSNDTCFLTDADVQRGYIEIETHGSFPKGIKALNEYPLISFIGYSRINPFYQHFSFYLNETGKPVYERWIHSDQNRVPNPSFTLKKTVDNTGYIVSQPVTFPDDFEAYGYERYPLTLRMVVTKEGYAGQINLAAYYNSPRWDDRIYHVLPGKLVGGLDRVERSAINVNFSFPSSIDIVSLERTILGRDPDWKDVIDQLPWPTV